MVNRPDAIVMGGGLAGIAAAVRLAERGAAVTLLETSRRLGGRATSHEDPATGRTLDNCQHVLLGCCTHLIDLYERLGVADRIRWDRRLHFFDKQGHHDILEAGGLPAPLHLTGSLRRFGCLKGTEKRAISRAMLAMMRIGPRRRDALEGVSFRDWLIRRRQPEGAIERFWSVIVVSALNTRPERASAAAAIQVFQDGFLAHRDAYAMGTAGVPLRRLYDPAVERIERAGGRVRFGASVEKIECEEGRVSGVRLREGERLQADHYISALPFDRLQRVAAERLRDADDRLAGLNRFEHSPILGIHLWLAPPGGRPDPTGGSGAFLDQPHMIFVDSPLQWVFNKGVHEHEASPTGYAQYLHGVISAADEWVGRPARAILDRARRELAAYLPAAAEAEMVNGRVIKEKRATFAITPGIEAHRPPTRGRVENLLLAGDWTDTGWPATMEGAVRSGDAAADAAGDHANADAHAADPPADLPASTLYRLIAATGGA